MSNFHWYLGLYVTWPTSYEALVGRAELKQGTYHLNVGQYDILTPVGEWLLVTAAAGGVGIAACQLGKGKDLCMFFTSSFNLFSSKPSVPRSSQQPDRTRNLTSSKSLEVLITRSTIQTLVGKNKFPKSPEGRALM
jgi:hypothetical protein